ncbi:MAG TPA: dihydropteroate synthase [bacterium]|nr:dihydropteroate synthase [bacterium]
MKFNLHLSAARSDAEAGSRLAAVKADEDGIEAMAPKLRHYCAKLEAVPAPAATVIKERMLMLGGEAAVSGEVYAGGSGPTDVLLMGTAAQLRALGGKLMGQGPGLEELAADLAVFLDRVERRVFTVPTPRGELALGKAPVLMGIVNCTPDSFYDGGRHFDQDAAIRRGLTLLEAGAGIVDVGGESTRPGSDAVSDDEESRRVLPVIERLAAEPDALISIDTVKPAVARRAMEAGAAMINDVSALTDPEMARAAADTGAALVLMHMRGTPKTMQQDPHYDDLFGEIIAYLALRMERAMAAGVHEESIIVDPGIGFGKTVAHNLELIRDLWRLRTLGRPILLGHSNKSYIGAVLNADKDDRFEGTAASLVAGIMSGAQIVRVHDVKGMRRYAEMAGAIQLGYNWKEP